MRKFPLPSRLARTGCSVLALATVFVVGPSPAAAQSFLGTGTATNGAATTITNGPGTTTISVTAPQTVINWVPTDNATNNGVPIAFQNSGTTASFLGTGSFAVLNNITATDLSRAISMNGTITSGPLGAVPASGSIYFYSPSGILLGGSSMINVGSLVLSASPIFVDGSGNFVNGPARQVIFGPALHPTAAITTSAGSQINTTTGDVYVAMVAPRIQHGGSINVNGSVALVAAEAAVINFSPDGLFDIQVTTGTTDSEGVSVNGDITGSASTNPAVARRAFLVAVPKNTALTMLIGSGADLGFDVAGAANVSGNAVILSAGHDIVDGEIGGVSAGSVAGTLANLEVNDGTYTSAVFGDTTGFAHFFANSPMYFHSAVDIHADGEIWFSTQGSAGTIDVDGSLMLSTERYGLFGQSITTSLVNLYTINGGGRITVDGSTTLDSTAHGGQSGTSGTPGGDASAGVIRISANDGGTIQLFGGLTAAADAFAGGAFAAGVDGGDALGGDIRIRTTGDNSNLTINGATNLTANAYGGHGDGLECFSCDGDGGDGRGGDIDIFSDDGTGATLNLNGNVQAIADGYGGSAQAASSVAGTGYGGAAAFYVGTDARMILNGTLLLQAEGNGGSHSGGNGGAGLGGEAAISETLTATSGTIVINGDVELSSDGQGGNSSGVGASGGTGTGGGVTGSSYILSDTGSIDIDGSVNLHSSGTGGDSINGVGGIGNGGESRLRSNSRLAISGGATLSADGTGGNSSGGAGGIGYGGDIAEIIATGGGDITIEGYASVSASGYGGDGVTGGGGYGSGDYDEVTQTWSGGAHIYARNGDIVINGGAQVSATGTGGDASFIDPYAGDYGGAGGDGFGGYATIHAANSDFGPSSITIDPGESEGSGIATVYVDGHGGDGGDGGDGGTGGAGGIGTGGTGGIHAAAGNGTVTIDQAFGFARGFGGDGGDGGDGGNGGESFAAAGGNGGVGGLGVGGYVTVGTVSGSAQSVAVNQGLGDYGSVTVDVSGFGGDGGDGGFGSTNGNGGNGGDARGGGVNLLVRGSQVDVDVATLTANATGGDGGSGDGETSSDGIGGNAVVGSNAGPNFINGIAIVATGRYLIPTQRGTLNAGTITGTAIATAGIGSSDGTSQNLGGSEVTFLNADGNIGSLDVIVDADAQATGAVQESISIINGDVVVEGEFSFVTSGNLSLFADNGDMHAGTITLDAADFVPDTETVTPVDAGTFFATSFDIDTDNNFITTAHLDSVATLTIVAPGAIQIGNVTGDNAILLNAQGAEVDIGHVVAGGGIDIDAMDFIFTGNITANGIIDLDAGSSISTGSILNTGNTSLNAGSSINVGTIDSGTGSVSLVTNNSGSLFGSTIVGGSIYADSDGDIFLGDLTASGDIELIAVGDMMIGNAIAGETIDLDAGGYIDGGNMTAGDSVYAEAGDHVDLLAVSAGMVDPSSGYDADYNVGILAGTTIDTGDIEAVGSIGLGAAGNITTGNIDAGNIFLALSGGNMSFGTINAAGQTYLADDSMIALGGDPSDGDFDPAPILAATPVASGGSIALGGPVNTGRFEAAAGTTLTGTTINSNSLLYATSGGNMTLGNLVAGDDVRLTSGGNIATGSIYSYDDVALVAAGSILTLDIFAYDDVSGDAGTTITTDDITGNSIELFADGDITTGDLLTRNFFSGEEAHALIPGTSITVASGGDVDVGTIDALDGVHVSAVGTISADTIDADDFVVLNAGGNITAGTINAGGYIDIFSDTGLLDLDDLHAGTEIDLESDGSLQFGDATAADFNFEMGGSVDGGNIDAINHADGHAEGAIVLENITVTGPPNDGDFSIGFTSATAITVENVDGFDRVGFATVGDLSTGTIKAGSLFVALVGGDIVTGSITTDANGRVYMADESMCQGSCGDDDDNGDDGDVEIEAILAQSPVPTGGSITINGAVATGNFEAAAGDNLVTRAITANSIEASAGETATIDGIWLAPSVSLASGDINITANGRIDAGNSGSILLNAVSTDGPALIGDGLTGNGYALSNAEFGRISGGEITIEVGGSGGDADMMIGDLTITGPLAGSNVESSDGGVHFVTLSETGDDPDGTLRVVGDVVATGFGAENYLAFYTQNFELDAATGSIAITSSGTTLAGILELYASRIHIAEGGLLNQLAANPQFAGYREALNAPATVQRPEGVIRAASFDIEFGGQDITGPYTLFVQNMGTAAVPAGFLLNAASIGEGEGEGAGDLSAGSVDMAINGQIITASGTSTGIAVRDLLVAEFGTTAFVAGSTINGCPLTGSCGSTVPSVDTPRSTDIPLAGSDGLGDGLFGNEGEIAGEGEGSDGSGRTNPITPPNPLFDSRPLTQSGDIDDPVSGAGNPSLYGLPEDGAAVCDSAKDKTCKVSEKGDGK